MNKAKVLQVTKKSTLPLFMYRLFQN